MSTEALVIAARRSELSQIQARSVARACTQHFPELKIDFVWQATQGDRDTSTPLAQFGGKGAFTSDLSALLLSGSADMVVHSWKDLPVDVGPQTHVAATLDRGDVRDLILFHRDVVKSHDRALKILSSSPRREFLIGQFLEWAFPIAAQKFSFESVRGNVATRLRKYSERQGDAIVIAKAALDRFLADTTPEFDGTRQLIRQCLNNSAWMVVPISACPCAPGQGALALEIRKDNARLADMCARLNSTYDFESVECERELLSKHGGGCHLAIGATVLKRSYGTVTVQRGKTPAGEEFSRLELARLNGKIPRAQPNSVWPATRAQMREQDAEFLDCDSDKISKLKYLWISKERALPQAVKLSAQQLVWTAGLDSWRKLAARGVWANGSAEALGEQEDPRVSLLLDQQPKWTKLSHAQANVGALDLFPTYRLTAAELPEDLPAKTHFFWRSGSLFSTALERYPSIASGFHACGPGNTFEAIKRILGSSQRLFVALSFDSWLQEVSAE